MTRFPSNFDSLLDPTLYLLVILSLHSPSFDWTTVSSRPISGIGQLVTISVSLSLSRLAVRIDCPVTFLLSVNVHFAIRVFNSTTS